VEIKQFKSVLKGAVLGVVDVQLDSGMVLHGCMIFAKEDRVWANAPSERVMDRAGQPMTSLVGKPVYRDIVSFKDRKTQQRWSDGVIAALRAKYPDVLPDAPAPAAAPLSAGPSWDGPDDDPLVRDGVTPY
jgi:DNA-binding cell septation regulator SpoVG